MPKYKVYGWFNPSIIIVCYLKEKLLIFNINIIFIFKLSVNIIRFIISV